MYVRNKSIPMVILLSIFTCGIYYYIWMYQTSEEINNTLGDQDSPGLEVLFSILTCGIYGIYWFYKYSLKMQKLSGKMGVPLTDNTTLYLVLMIVNYFAGVLIFISQGIFQSQINQLADACPSAPYQQVQNPGWTPAPQEQPQPAPEAESAPAPEAESAPAPEAQPEPAPEADEPKQD